MAYADTFVESVDYNPPASVFPNVADASYSITITTLGAGFFQPDYITEGPVFGTLSVNITGLVPFTNGQTFTLTGHANDGVVDGFDRTFVALRDIQVFDAKMNPLGTVTSGRVVSGVPEPGSVLLILAGIAALSRARRSL
jgi:hypothetical protein